MGSEWEDRDLIRGWTGRCSYAWDRGHLARRFLPALPPAGYPSRRPTSPCGIRNPHAQSGMSRGNLRERPPAAQPSKTRASGWFGSRLRVSRVLIFTRQPGGTAGTLLEGDIVGVLQFKFNFLATSQRPGKLPLPAARPNPEG